MKKTALAFFLILFLILIAGFVFGQQECEICPPDMKGGLVPCGRNCDDPDTPENECDPCTICHFFIMIDRWIDRALFLIVPPLAALMIAIGGGMYIFSQGKPEMISQAKKLFTSVIIGLIIIYGAWVIVNTFLTAIGTAEWTGLEKGWWIIKCQ